MVHRVQAVLLRRQLGECLWSWTSSQYLKRLKQFLLVLGFQGATALTLKAFRAGKATELAAEGKTIGQILRAGEWKSAAFLAYIDEDAVDAAQLLDTTLAQSEEEA